jgi:hypothetical protein
VGSRSSQLIRTVDRLQGCVRQKGRREEIFGGSLKKSFPSKKTRRMSRYELASKFQLLEARYESIVEKGNSEDSDVAAAIELTENCIQQREAMSLFSKNEGMEDFSTGIIKYLYLEYYLAKFLTQCLAQDRRHIRLQKAKEVFETFLERCCSLPGLLHKEETSQFAALFPNNYKSLSLTEGGVEKKSLGFDGEDADDKDKDEGGKAGGVISASVAAGRALELSMKQATPTVFSVSPEEQRNLKVARFRREQESKKRVKALRAMLASRRGGRIVSGGVAASKHDAAEGEREGEGEGGREGGIRVGLGQGSGNGDGEGHGSEDEGDEEEELREIYILQLQSFARNALDEVPLIEQEQVMLSLMRSMRAQEMNSAGAAAGAGEGGSGGPGRAQDGRFNDRNDPTGRARANIAQLPTLPALPPPGTGPGIEITRTSKGADGSVLMDKETIRANVFVPSMQGPSMTLEEFGDMEKAAAIERSRVQAENAATGKGADTENLTRRYANLEADGDEDVMRLVDAATYNDRDWDTFKEHNPKGWGNKAGKRF